MITDKQFLINKARKEGGLHKGEKPLFQERKTLREFLDNFLKTIPRSKMTKNY